MPLVTVDDAIRLLPTVGGKSVSRATFWRWMDTGVRGNRLAFSYLGRRRMVDTADLVAFLGGGGGGVGKEVRLAAAALGLQRFGY
jgi:hypothetical protein